MLDVVLLAMIVLVVLLVLGVPLPYCFGGSLLTMTALGGVTMKGMMMWGFNQLANPVLLCIPLFILAGNLMSESGIARSLLDFVNVFVGRVKGALGVVAVITCAIIGAISGSGFTGVAATGPILIPRMVEEGYPRGYATALITVSSILGLLIPPSVIMIIYGWVTETSILACFLATIGPGLLIMCLFSILNLVYAHRLPNLTLVKKLPKGQRRKVALRKTWKALPALMMPVIILGGIYGGVFTPTEAAAVSVIYSLPVGFGVYKGLTKNKLKESIVDSATSVGAIMSMIVFCLMLSQTFIFLRVPQAIIKIMFGLTENRVVLLILINLLLFLIGMIVNDVTGMVQEAGIPDGARITINPEEPVYNGDSILVKWGRRGDLAVKWYYEYKDHIELRSSNPGKYPPIIISKEEIAEEMDAGNMDFFRICGKVMSVSVIPKRGI